MRSRFAGRGAPPRMPDGARRTDAVRARRRVRRAVLAAALAAAGMSLGPALRAAEPEFGGQLRAQWTEAGANARGPLAAADALRPGLVPPPASGPLVEAELRANAHVGGVGLSGIATLQSQRPAGGPTASRAWFDELYASWDAASWQFSAGKRIVAWDVGYGFRPNDVVEQEPRRLLLATTPEGRPLLAAERFDADTAWTLVLVNPTHARSARGADEPALAARVYRRDGALDWHGFARLGARTGASAGAAFSWVAGEAVELHASARYLVRADTLAPSGIAAGTSATVPAGTLAAADPWRPASVSRTGQALVGGTWTNAQQLSLLAEAWWDGTALADAQWDRWAERNAALAGGAGRASALAVAGNLAWQADAFRANAANLRRANVFARLSWQHDKWQPAVDVLYTPADAGRAVTASLGWQGDRVRLDAGLRVYGGPGSAVLAQLPVRRIAFAAATFSF